MELEQAQEMKAELEKKVAELLKEFSKETNLKIERVNVESVAQYGGINTADRGREYFIYIVEIEAKL